MEFIYGKLNKEVEIQEYKGLDTNTAFVNVDNVNHTISVDVKNTGSSESCDSLYKDKLNLADYELSILYNNIKLLDFINDKAILNTKDNQTINGNLNINGNLSANGILNLNSTDKNGIQFNNYKKDLDALIYISENGQIKFNSDASNKFTEQTVLTAGDLTANMFTFYNGSNIATRYILPSDIYVKNYKYTDIVNNNQLTNKEYVDKAVRRNTNYGIVNTYADFAKVTAWQGRRVHIIECDTESDEQHINNPNNNPMGEEVNAINE